MKKMLFIFLCLTVTSVFGQWSDVKPMLGKQINWAHPLSKGIVGYWLMNEGTGNKVFDSSGNGNTGTLEAGLPPTWVPGKFGSGLSFDRDAIQCGTACDTPTALTIIVWINSDGDYGTYNHIVAKRHGQPTNKYRYDFLLKSSTGSISFFNGSSVFDSSVPPPSNEWSQVAVTLSKASSGVLTFYLNGLPIYSTSPVSLDTDTDAMVNIGAHYGGTGWKEYLFGIIDHVSIYNRALSASEIALLYQEPFCMFKRDNVAMMEASIPVVEVGGQVIIIAQMSLFLIPMFFVVRAMRK